MRSQEDVATGYLEPALCAPDGLVQTASTQVGWTVCVPNAKTASVGFPNGVRVLVFVQVFLQQQNIEESQSAIYRV